MSYATQRSLGSESSQSDIDHLTPIDVQCRRDDRFFNLLYRNYNWNSINSYGQNSRTYTSETIRTDQSARDGSLEQMRVELNRDNIQSAPDLPYHNPNTISHYQCGRVYPSSVNYPWSAAEISRIRQRVETLHEAPPLQPYPCRSDSIHHISDEQCIPFEQSIPYTSASSERFPVEHPIKDSKNTVLGPYKCPVCLKCVQQRQPTATTCGHVFCSSCIRTALRATCRCPVCQSRMTTRHTFRIYI